eukprot:TRINITY_DN220_c1_g3_i1.p1 TRINITY_DN220_c1_g3~~TRINITY_DN220_c1_g3_i1.p1  ORF type:complete len:301 (+),score=53.47 TRINITY_DN220_c1_g3_i1:44-946(+)
MKLKIAETLGDLNILGATLVKKHISLHQLHGKNRPFVLGVAVGGSTKGIFEHLIKSYRKKEISFENVIIFQIDEYFGIQRDDPMSQHSQLYHSFLKFVDVRPQNVHVMSCDCIDLDEECEDFEHKIKEAGGIDLFITGVGSDGHLGRNEPGSSLMSRTRPKALSHETRLLLASNFGSIGKVPKLTLTMGVHTILDSRAIVAIYGGVQKAKALRRTVEMPMNHMCVASAFQAHPDCRVICDQDAAIELRIRTAKYFKNVEEIKKILKIDLTDEILASEVVLPRKRDPSESTGIFLFKSEKS